MLHGSRCFTGRFSRKEPPWPPEVKVMLDSLEIKLTVISFFIFIEQFFNKVI